MEETKPADNSATLKLPSQPPQAQAQAAPRSKKRPLDNNVQIQDSNYYKMRLLLKDLRPHFLELLKTPDFRNCKASHEIQEKLKTLMELYKQITSETISVKKCKDISEDQQPQDVKLEEQHPPDGAIAKLSENKPFQSGTSMEQQPVDGDGSHVIGGSAIGWNFITFSGGKSVYYGVTKESFRRSQVNLQAQ